LSRYKLQAQPLCELCLRAGKIEPATLVDHIVALEEVASYCRRSMA
jgi:hypothetical protein